MKKEFGKYFWSEDKYYEGQRLNNKKHGKGRMHFEGKEINVTFRFGKIIKENKVEYKVILFFLNVSYDIYNN